MAEADKCCITRCYGWGREEGTDGRYFSMLYSSRVASRIISTSSSVSSSASATFTKRDKNTNEVGMEMLNLRAFRTSPSILMTAHNQGQDIPGGSRGSLAEAWHEDPWAQDAEPGGSIEVLHPVHPRWAGAPASFRKARSLMCTKSSIWMGHNDQSPVWETGLVSIPLNSM